MLMSVGLPKQTIQCISLSFSHVSQNFSMYIKRITFECPADWTNNKDEVSGERSVGIKGCGVVGRGRGWGGRGGWEWW